LSALGVKPARAASSGGFWSVETGPHVSWRDVIQIRIHAHLSLAACRRAYGNMENNYARQVSNLLSPHRLLLSLIILLAFCGICLCIKAESIYVPDIILWVDARTPQSGRVSLTYSKAIPRTQVEADLEKILKETAWVATNVSISDGASTNVGEPPMTTLEFSTTSAVLDVNGLPPIEPIVIALKEYKSIEILYMVPPQAKLLAPKRFENKHIKLAIERGKNFYRYRVDIKRSDFDVLKLPIRMPGQVEPETSVRKHFYLLLPLAVILALLIGVTTFLIATSIARSRGRDRDWRS
ncbi:MAG: hypothetical protein ACPL7O_12865, partial [Armatimonadota bacterium]